MARSPKAVRYEVEIEDVRGSFRRLTREGSKELRRFMGTAVFLTAGALRDDMEAGAPLGPEGEGATPFEHIKLDIEHHGRVRDLSAQVGLFDADQAEVGLFNEYSPNEQPFMRPAAEAESGPFKSRAERAIEQTERALRSGL